MKILIPLMGALAYGSIVCVVLLFAGCASTEPDQPNPPAPSPSPAPTPSPASTNGFDTFVLQADKDWAAFVRSGGASKENAEAVQDVRDAYEESARNYIDLVYELMIPPLAAPPKRK